MALLVERYGVPAGISLFDLMQIDDVLGVIRAYQLAGSKRQHQLSSGDWKAIVELDQLAAEAEEAAGE